MYGSPLTVSSSKTIWSSVVESDSSCVILPLTTETLAVALPELKFIVSPISYPVPPSSTIISLIEPEPIAST